MSEISSVSGGRLRSNVVNVAIVRKVAVAFDLSPAAAREKSAEYAQQAAKAAQAAMAKVDFVLITHMGGVVKMRGYTPNPQRLPSQAHSAVGP